MCKKVAFIGCSKKKRTIPCMAREMYRGSLFQKSLTYCLGEGYDTYILSAKYGLLSLNEKISPYEETLKEKNKQQRKEWASKVQKQIEANHLCGEFFFFCGKNYHEQFAGVKVFEGLGGLGYQLQYLSNLIKKQKYAKK